MKIARYANAVEVSMTPQEALMFQGKHFRAEFNPESEREFLMLAVSPDGFMRIRPRNSQSHPWTASVGNPLKLQKRFGAEDVQTWSPGEGILYAHKPKMNKAVVKRALRGPSDRPRKPFVPPKQEVALEHIHQAVRLVNNFKRSNPDDVELEVKGGELVVRMIVEFGKDKA